MEDRVHAAPIVMKIGSRMTAVGLQAPRRISCHVHTFHETKGAHDRRRVNVRGFGKDNPGRDYDEFIPLPDEPASPAKPMSSGEIAPSRPQTSDIGSMTRRLQ